MAKKYSFSIHFGNETFKLDGADSFDEAIKIVEKAVNDRQLAYNERAKKNPGQPPATAASAAPKPDSAGTAVNGTPNTPENGTAGSQKTE